MTGSWRWIWTNEVSRKMVEATWVWWVWFKFQSSWGDGHSCYCTIPPPKEDVDKSLPALQTMVIDFKPTPSEIFTPGTSGLVQCKEVLEPMSMPAVCHGHGGQTWLSDHPLSNNKCHNGSHWLSEKTFWFPNCWHSPTDSSFFLFLVLQYIFSFVLLCLTVKPTIFEPTFYILLVWI